MRGTTGGMPGDKAAQVRAKIDAYVFAVQAVLALEKIFAETLQAQARQGPKMETSTGAEVAPDMTFEVAEGRFAGYRAVNEIKSQYPPRGRARRRLVRQLQQYDDIESGWSLPAVSGEPSRTSYDLILTVPAGHAGDYVANLSKDLRASGVGITREICILGLGRDSQHSDGRLLTRIMHGCLSVPTINKRLAGDGEHERYGLLGGVNAIRFYDSDPPVPYTMSVLWSHVFLNTIHGKKRRSMLQGRTVKIMVDIRRVHKLLSKFAPSSNPRCIKMSWVRSALDMFVDVKLAAKIGDGKYEIWYRDKQFVLDWLVGLVDNANGRVSRRAGGGGRIP